MNRREAERQGMDVSGRTVRVVDHEQHAQRRLALHRKSYAAVQVSHAGAARALADLSPEALRLVWGMVTLHSGRGGGDCVLGDAVVIMGGRKLTWRTLDELHAAGLLQFNKFGRYELHPLVGSIAHRLFEIGHGVERSVGRTDNVVSISRRAQA